MFALDEVTGTLSVSNSGSMLGMGLPSGCGAGVGLKVSCWISRNGLNQLYCDLRVVDFSVDFDPCCLF